MRPLVENMVDELRDLGFTVIEPDAKPWAKVSIQDLHYLLADRLVKHTRAHETLAANGIVELARSLDEAMAIYEAEMIRGPLSS